MQIPEHIRQFLMSSPRFPVLATVNPGGTIQQSVMWFDLDGDTVVMNTKSGRAKHRNMTANPHVSLCFEQEGTYVTLAGRVEMNDDQEIAKAGIHQLAVRYDGQEAADRELREVYAHQERVALRMTVERIFSHGVEEDTTG